VNRTYEDVSDVLQTGVDRALWHIRRGQDVDARLALEVALTAALRITGEASSP
jgi:hypothetical protein